jgi:hypothetical protein
LIDTTIAGAGESVKKVVDVKGGKSMALST